MLDILRQSYNTGAGNATQFPDGNKSSPGVAIRVINVTLGAQINDGANADVYIPQRGKLLHFIVTGDTTLTNAVFTLNNGNLRIAANGANLAANRVFNFLLFESAV